MTGARHRDPVAHPRTVTRPLYAGLCLADAGVVLLAAAALLGVGAAPDAAARATVPLPTAARSVTVEVSYDPAPSMSIGADGAWDPETAQSPVAVSQPPVQPRSTPTTVRRPTVTSGPGAVVPVPTTPATTTPTTTPATEAAATPTASPTASPTVTTAPSTEPSPTGLPVVDPIETEESQP